MLNAIKQLVSFIATSFTSKIVKRELSESDSANSIEGVHKLKRAKLDKPEERCLRPDTRIKSLDQIAKPDLKIVNYTDFINISKKELINHTPHQEFNKDLSTQNIIKIGFLNRRINDSSLEISGSNNHLHKNKEETKLINKPNEEYYVTA